MRLAVGAVSLGSDELIRRLRTIPRESAPGPTGSGVDDHELGIVTLAGLGVGIAVESTQLVGRVMSTTAGGSRRAADRIRRATRLPLVNLAAGPVQRQYGRYEAAIRKLSRRGRLEQLAGRRMVEVLIRDTTTKSAMGIAEFAVNEVTHSPEVAALVRRQSAGLATDTILEVRANSEQADDRLESRVHSWLHLPKPGDRARRDASLGDTGSGSRA